MNYARRSTLFSATLNVALDKDYGNLAAEQEKLLQRVEANARELLELINATLDVSRFDAGRLLLDRKEVDLVTLMEELQQGKPPPASSTQGWLWTMASPRSALGAADRSRKAQNDREKLAWERFKVHGTRSHSR